MRIDHVPAGILSTDTLRDVFFTPEQAWPAAAQDEHHFDACACLLARVDFKWLMAGQGWWIDPHRFQYDRAYAAAALRFALVSPSFALRACAASLQAQLDNAGQG